ncbi:amino acid ABC transporter ATP-binding protein [Homoserinibacter sp. YIM 151385]|uniref:amino acid ABC transporter ATP-binding protein n=1 Tax=Homoserinibacter sp. YIM 151385 TaxID=2985506 RepID=UPI0022F1234D|nr:amino acid ABC transporter ATP-binding protein [Homoserinibacter sp. YIM 151385]WBU37164.1 amino acid ABC transporter ATP-binding protein [Homoserinibacter sp. YIM 151385]
MSRTPEPAAVPGAAPRLTVAGLRKSFGSNEVLRGVDLELERGRVLVLIGPSGSGKTTVLRSLNALEVPDAGVVAIDGEAIDFGAPASARVRAEQRARLRDASGMVFQHYNLFPHRTVLQNVTEGPVVVQRRPREEAEREALALLERVGLAEKRDAFPFELSGGQQQRVGIVRALALKPRLLLFDEPTSALDPEIVGDVLAIMSELAREGWTMVVVTHEIGFAREVADEVLFLDGGVIVERGAPAELLSAPREPRTRAFLERLLH